MNKQNIFNIPDEDKIGELLTKIQPLPSMDFHKKLDQANWRTEIVQRKITTNKPRLKLVIATFVILAITFLGATPQGRAWAQEAVQFFKRINSTTIQISDEQTRWMNAFDEQYDLPLVPVFIPEVAPEMAAISGCETPQKSQSYRCQVALAELKLGFDLKELPEKPKDWKFKSLYFNVDSQYAVMNYDLDFLYTTFTSYSNLVFTQGMGDFSNFSQYTNSPWEVVPADKVKVVSIGTIKGEYVKGGFSLFAGDDKLVWNERDREQRLAWSDGTHWYLIQYWPNLNIAEYWPNLNPTGTMNKEQLIQLAESLVAKPIETAESMNFDQIPSISDAEEISGLDLKAPTLIPMDVNFTYARYFADLKQVKLIYGINEELTIVEWAGKSVKFNRPSDTYEIVKINSDDAYFGSTGGADSHLFLWWHKDGLNYQMLYDQTFGGKIYKDDMISIAESMQDIDDFKKENNRNYEQIAVYEQAFGIEIKKFPETPVGWSFSNFWGDAHARCIGMIYAATTEQSTLFINQCATDRRSDVSIYPSKAIKRVNMTGNKGYYIVGGFVTNDDGKQVWDLTIPTKQLYWQEDGLWMQITLYGDQAFVLNKDDLITIAENLP